MKTRRSKATVAVLMVLTMLASIAGWEAVRAGRASAQLLSNGGGLPHFKCYNFVPAGPPVKEPVTLIDQFVPSDAVVVQTQHYLCAPTTKVHNGQWYQADHDGEHLVCYHIRPSHGAVKADVEITDQFHKDQPRVGEITTAHLLCAPATKRLIGPTK